MRNPGIFRGAFIFLFFIGLFALASLGVMYLWNWLIPAVIGWSVINYWQALGLMVLCALMTDAANALGVTFGYNMSKESAEDYGELPDELLATPAVVG